MQSWELFDDYRPVSKTPSGEYYTQRGGQKREYISNEILEDVEGHPTVKEFLDNSRDINISLTISATLRMPNERFAEEYAKRRLMPQGFCIDPDGSVYIFPSAYTGELSRRVSNVSARCDVADAPQIESDLALNEEEADHDLEG